MHDETVSGSRSFCLGFGFSRDNTQVLLVQKSRGLHVKTHNGLGGLLHPGETPRAAMSREFQEESGIAIPLSDWGRAAFLFGVGWSVDVFHCQLPDTPLPRLVGDAGLLHLLPLTSTQWSLLRFAPYARMLIMHCLDQRGSPQASSTRVLSIEETRSNEFE